MFLYRYKASRLLRPLVSGSLCAALMLVGLLVPHTAQANIADLTVAPYDSCTASTANGIATFRMRAHLTSAIAFLAGRQDLSTWGVAVFFYDSQGNIKATPADANLKVSMNQKASVTTITYPYYRTTRVVSGPASNSPDALQKEYANSWHMLNAYTAAANLEITVNSNSISEFPGIGVSIALRNTSQTVHMDKRTAYLAVDTTGLSTCNEITTGTKPPQPPKPPVKRPLTVTVTDVDLGELNANGQVEKHYTSCGVTFSNYEPLHIYSEKMQIRVSNQNGTTGGSPNMFKLVHNNDLNATIPYTVEVSGMPVPPEHSNRYTFPNVPMALFNMGFIMPPTCMSFTLNTRTPTTAKLGDYMDILTFTVSNIP
jgi:hypothetical protein